MKHLVKKFAEAGLVLKILKNPIQRMRGQREIVQLDIGRKPKGNNRTEWFELYPGIGNNIQVLNIDKKSRQLTLLVDEPVREFEFEQHMWNNRRLLEAVAEAKRRGIFVKSQGITLVTKQKTDGQKRHFLLGVDERQLFIAQTARPITTVAEARRSLGSTVQFHEGKRKMTPNRQGEWFFIQSTRLQRELIADALKSTRAVIQRKQNIGAVLGRPGGNPHIADELVVMPRDGSIVGKTRRDRGLASAVVAPQRNKVFVRGKVRHVDHKTIKYNHWHEVIANNEGATGSGNASGITWVD